MSDQSEASRDIIHLIIDSSYTVRKQYTSNPIRPVNFGYTLNNVRKTKLCSWTTYEYVCLYN